MAAATTVPNYYLPMLTDALKILKAFETSASLSTKEMCFQNDGYLTTTKPTFPYMQLTPFSDTSAGAWKFHFSVEPNDRNVMAAWSLVVDALIHDGDKHIAKVAMPYIWDDLADPEFRQVGKIITFYDTGSYSPQDYMHMIAEIEKRFLDNGISAGHLPITNRAIAGSQFASYKRDCDEDGERRCKDHDVMHLPREQRHNPDNRNDPYSSFIL